MILEGHVAQCSDRGEWPSLESITPNTSKNSVTTSAVFSWHSLAVNLTVGIPSLNIMRLPVSD